MFRTNNPTMREKVFQEQSESVESSVPMTLNGTIAKTGILLLLLMVTSTISWLYPSPALMIVGLIGGLVTALVVSFKPHTAPIGAPIYALLKGLALGAISYWYSAAYADTKYNGIVPLAVAGTLFTLGVMLLLYRTRIIRVTQTFMMVVVGATLAIMITYVGTFALSLFGANVSALPIYGAGPIGLAFSAFVIVLAALNLCLDFHIIETGVESRAPKYMEWYGGFALLVTLVWLYLEMLRLLSKLARR